MWGHHSLPWENLKYYPNVMKMLSGNSFTISKIIFEVLQDKMSPYSTPLMRFQRTRCTLSPWIWAGQWKPYYSFVFSSFLFATSGFPCTSLCSPFFSVSFNSGCSVSAASISPGSWTFLISLRMKIPGMKLDPLRAAGNPR